MGGPKHKGQVISGETAPGAFKSETSQVNFIVPDRRTLTEEAKIVISDKPNILSLMIEQVAKSEQKTKQKTKSMGPTMIIKFFCHRRWSHRLISFCVFFLRFCIWTARTGDVFQTDARAATVHLI